MFSSRTKEPQLEGERIVVRLANGRDAPEIVRYYRENETHLATFESPKPRSFLTTRFWTREIERRREAFHRDRSCRMFLFDPEGDLTGTKDAVVGAVGITAIIRGAFHAAFLGYSLAGALQGRGLMHEALELVTSFAFGERNLHRLMANHSPRNARSARVLERLGFVQEGYARNYLFINGRWEDHVLRVLENPWWRTPAGFLRRDDDGVLLEVPPTGRG